MNLRSRIQRGVPSDAALAATEFAELFPAVYLSFHVRRKKRAELSARALGVLEHLALSGPLTVTEAARHMDRAQSVMSDMITALEAKKLVTRFADTRDRRRTLVWLTEAGQRRLIDDRRVLDPALLTHALSAMTADERRQLLSGTRALVRAAESSHNHKKER